MKSMIETSQTGDLCFTMELHQVLRFWVAMVWKDHSDFTFSSICASRMRVEGRYGVFEVWMDECPIKGFVGLVSCHAYHIKKMSDSTQQGKEQLVKHPGRVA